MRGTIAVGPGDGIGPEIMEEGVKVLKAVKKKYGHQFELNYFDLGGVSIDKFGESVTKANLDLCRKSDAILFGAAGGPKWDIPGSGVNSISGVLTIRKKFGLYANLRPVIVFPGMEGCSPLKPTGRGEGCRSDCRAREHRRRVFRPTQDAMGGEQ